MKKTVRIIAAILVVTALAFGIFPAATAAAATSTTGTTGTSTAVTSGTLPAWYQNYLIYRGKTTTVNTVSAAATPAPAATATPALTAATTTTAAATGSTGSLSSAQLQFIELTNQQREAAGLKPYIIDTALCKVATAKAQDMVDNNYFDHTSPTYGSPFAMMKQFGISYSAAGENIAMTSSVSRAVTGFMNSPGHKANILSSAFTHIGVGVVGNKYVQMFIRK